MAKAKTKWIELPKKFNSGVGKYESVLPARKGNPGIKVDWRWLISETIAVAILIYIIVTKI